jgi:hypothetical protein
MFITAAELCTIADAFEDAPPVQLPTIALAAPVLLRVITLDAPARMFAVTITPAASKKLPPAVPPVATVVIVAQVTLTLIVIDVLPFATRTSAGSSDAHVNHDPEPLAALFHWLTESMFTDEF